MTTHKHTINRKKSSTYTSWENMVGRCKYPSNPAYEYYKKRGIKVCEAWQVFDNFLEDMGEKPSKNHSIDRINNDGNYEPSNCRWATKQEQANNRITNIHFIYNGQKYTLAELARVTGVGKELLRARLCRSKKTWSVEDAVHTPVIPRTLRKRDFSGLIKGIL